MPIFFFNVRDGGQLARDPEGQDLPDLEAAGREAVAAAREMLAEDVRTGSVLRDAAFEITDADGVLRMTVRFRDTIRFG